MRSRIFRFFAALFVLASVFVPLLAQTKTIDPDQQYKTCMERVWIDPEGVYENALAWAGLADSDLAQRCVATALVALKHYRQAALRLERIATTSTAASAQIRAVLLAQAAQAWLMEGNFKTALAVIDAALALAPGLVDLTADRGRILALLDRDQEALIAFNKALMVRPEDLDLLVFRAAVLRRLNRLDQARTDLDHALQRQPDHVEGLLERGLVYRAQGHLEAARADFLAVALAAPNTPTSQAARLHIEQLDGPNRRR